MGGKKGGEDREGERKKGKREEVERKEAEEMEGERQKISGVSKVIRRLKKEKSKLTFIDQ